MVLVTLFTKHLGVECSGELCQELELWRCPQVWSSPQSHHSCHSGAAGASEMMQGPVSQGLMQRICKACSLSRTLHSPSCCFLLVSFLGDTSQNAACTQLLAWLGLHTEPGVVQSSLIPHPVSQSPEHEIQNLSDAPCSSVLLLGWLLLFPVLCISFVPT